MTALKSRYRGGTAAT